MLTAKKFLMKKSDNNSIPGEMFSFKCFASRFSLYNDAFDLL
jgi:hypothetical protein